MFVSARSSASTVSSRPAPNVVSSPGSPRSIAVSTNSERKSARSASALPPSAASSDGRASRSSAATAATCGAAALVPKNGVTKLPLPVTRTPSTAVRSGLITPFLVGPRLLYTSMVSRPGSRWSTAATEITPPPASLCASTLLAIVLKFSAVSAPGSRGVSKTYSSRVRGAARSSKLCTTTRNVPAAPLLL